MVNSFYDSQTFRFHNQAQEASRFHYSMRNNNPGRKTAPQPIDTSDQPSTNRKNNPLRTSGFRASSPSNSSGKRVMFKSNIDSVSSDFASGGQQLENILLRNNSKGISIQDAESGSGFNAWGNPAFSKMLCERMARQILSLKQSTRFFKSLLAEQQQQFSQFRENTTQQILRKIQKHHIEVVDKIEKSKSSSSSIEAQLNKKKKQNGQLLKEIQVLRVQKEQFSWNKSDDVYSKSGGYCSNCRLLQIKLDSTKQQAVNSSRQLHKAQNQIQKLQETIFDLQQQVVGIDLEVEKKLKKAIMEMPELRGQPQKDQPPNTQIIEDLRQSLDKAETRCRHYESLCKTEDDLFQREQQLEIRQKQYELKNEALLEAIARAQETNNKNYEKEHELLLAEEQYYQKLEALRAKEVELSQWQKSIAHQNIAQQLSVSFAPRSSGHIQGHDQISMKNLAVQRNIQAEDEYYNIDSRKNHTHNDLVRSGDNFHIPKLPLRDQDVESRVSHNRPSSQYQQQSRYTNKQQYHNPRITTHQTNSRISQPYRAIISPSPSNKHLGVGDRYRASNSRNKDMVTRHSGIRDRSSSPARSFKSSHMVSNHKGNSYGGPYNKAENKLERLREELKKQLDSIK